MTKNHRDNTGEFCFHENDNLVKVIKRSLFLNTGITFINGSDVEEFLSYVKLYELACQRLYCLQKFGMSRRRELILQLEDNKDFLVTFWACILGGIVPVPLSIGKNNDYLEKVMRVWSQLNNPMLITTKDRIKEIVDYGKTHHKNDIEEFIISVEACETSFESGQIFEPEGEDIAFIQFSSGSTGIPKGVCLTHHNIIANIVGISESAKYTTKDSLLSWMPLTHDMGMIGFHLNPLYCGINSYLIPTNAFVRKPTLWIDKASEHQVSVLCSPNFGYRYLLKYVDNRTSEKEWDLSRVRIIYNGAEPISLSLCHEFIEAFSIYGLKRNSMCPVYGLAEASVAVSMSSLSEEVKSVALDRNTLKPGQEIKVSKLSGDAIRFVNVGRPVAGCQVRITHKSRQVRAGIIGNLEIRGINVTSGYYNNIVATKKAINRAGWLSTGDIGFIHEGDLYITGRSKDILFVNGRNFYVHDIENEAQKIHGIELNKIAVCGYSEHATGSEKMIAFVQYRDRLDDFLLLASQLNATISSIYGIHFDTILPVKTIPKTTSGKLQRFKLLEQFLNNEFDEIEKKLIEVHQKSKPVNISSPTNDLELLILNVWKEVLQVEDLGVDSKFSEVGGNSLMATMLVAKLELACNVKLSTNLLYEHKTVKVLSDVIAQLPKIEHQPITVFSKREFYPLSYSQKRIYLAWKIDKNKTAYNLPILFKLDGKVNEEKLENALNQVIKRHDILKSKFSDHIDPVWSVKDNLQIPLLRIERSNVLASFDQLIKPFDLLNGPLIRAALISNPGEGFKLLFLDFHHIISDGRSVHNFIWDLLKCYDGETLETLLVQYSDFTLWQHRLVQQETGESRRYWSEMLKDTKTLNLPIDFPRPNVLSGHGKRIFRSLDATTSMGLRQLAIDNNVTLHSILFTAYYILLCKYSGENKITIGIPVHGRIHPDLDQQQGVFVGALPIANEIAGETFIGDALRMVHSRVIASLDHQDFPFDEIVRQQNSTTLPGRSPLFDTMYNFQNDGITGKATKDFRIVRYSFDPAFSKFDLSLDVIDRDSEITCDFEYSTDLFLEHSIVSMADSFFRIISHFLAGTETRIDDIRLASYTASLHTTCNVNFKSVVDEIKAYSISRPFSIAVVANGVEMTYRDLYDHVLKATYHFEKLGLEKGDRVAVHLLRSIEFIVTVLGVLNMGAAFVPLDTDFPDDHKRDILEDSECALLIHSQTTCVMGDVLTLVKNNIFVEDIVRERQAGMSKHEIAGEDLAYIIYTSGTTGSPKGVMIGHESLSNYIHWACQEYIGQDVTTFPLYSSISFDLTITSIFAPLVSGNTVVAYDKVYDNDVLIKKVFEDDRVDIVKLTPSHLKILRDNNLVRPDTRIKKYILGGEALESKLARDLCAAVGNVSIWNEYGPTEATVGCMIHKFDLKDEGDQVSIGKGIENARIYLLDETRKPIPPGTVGEIFIAGNVIAKGYLNKKELTNERFIDDPFIKGEKMYRTGDFAKERPDGNFEYLGRQDGQVKINGNRVELSHIQNTLLRYQEVTDATVMLAEDGINIFAFYVLKEKKTQVDEVFWRRQLSTKLPHYMIPSKFFAVQSLPLTINGKVDTKYLLTLIHKNPTSNVTTSHTELQKSFLAVWREIFEIDNISIDDNFYQLGGDSIKAVLISAKLHENGLAVKAKDILLHHTIRQISETVDLMSEDKPAPGSFPEGKCDLGPIQHWFFNQNFGNPDFYTQSVVLKLNREIDIDLLSQSFDGLIHNHDTLRLNYDQKSKCMFYNNELLNDRFIVGNHQVETEGQVVKLCQQRKKQLKIREGILVKADVIKLTSTNTLLLFITAHHLIIDGISWRVLLSDLYQFYFEATSKFTVLQKKKAPSYKEYVKCLNESLEHFATERNYWKKHTPDHGSVIPEDKQVEFDTVSDLGVSSTIIDENTTRILLKDANRAYNTNPLILLNTALVLALEEWTGLKNYVIEQEQHGRDLEALEFGRTVGWFTSIFPLKLTYTNDLVRLIKSVKETFKKVPNNGMGYGINKYLFEKSNQVDRPEVRLNYLGQFGGELNNDLFTYLPDFGHGPDSDPENSLTAKLEFNCMVFNDQLNIKVNYNRNAFHVSTMKHLLALLEKHLSSVLAHVTNKKEVDFTPSDFVNASLDNEEMNALFI